MNEVLPAPVSVQVSGGVVAPADRGYADEVVASLSRESGDSRGRVVLDARTNPDGSITASADAILILDEHRLLCAGAPGQQRWLKPSTDSTRGCSVRSLSSVGPVPGPQRRHHAGVAAADHHETVSRHASDISSAKLDSNLSGPNTCPWWVRRLKHGHGGTRHLAMPLV
jgi:hypothetical protein